MIFYEVILFFFVSLKIDHNFYFYTCSFQSEALAFC